MPCIVPIVEGPGDVDAVPVLVRRILECHQWFDWSVARPKKAGNLGKLKRNLDRYVLYAQKERGCGAILILLDLDDGCPKDEAYDLAVQARELASPYPIAIVLAHREYEAWFLASMATIAGHVPLPTDLVYEGNVEDRRDAKGWLTARMPPGRAYKETIHQARFASLIDLDIARQRSRSFRRLLHAVEQLVQLAGTDPTRGFVTPQAACQG